MPLDPYANLPLDPYVEQLRQQRIAARDAAQSKLARDARLQEIMLQRGATPEAAARLYAEEDAAASQPPVRITGMYTDSTMPLSAYDIDETIQPGTGRFAGMEPPSIGARPPQQVPVLETSGSAGPAPAPPPASRLAQDADPDLQALFGDVQSGASSTAIPAIPPGAPRDPRFANVEGGGGSSVRGAHIMGEASRPDPGVLRVDLGDGGGFQDVSQGQPLQRATSIEGDLRSAWDPVDQRTESYRVPQGGGTFSMMTAPENASRVTFASDLEAAQQESALRTARGEPSPADIYRTEAAVRGRFGPAEELKFQEAEATNAEIVSLIKRQRELQQAVETGRLSPGEAQRLFEEAREDAAFRIQSLRGGSLSAWGPEKDSFGDLGALPPAG